MKPTNDQEAPNETIALLRRLAAEKRETKRQMREAFKNDPEIQRIVRELDDQNAQRKYQSV
ncbi:hypothetical protein ACFSUS_05695 [Spirosoma soli]|uniref:Uncharacterized protein n=1 Tax=Spirosoma soli TaxID=1770529 RepID=A0ABW5M1G2_9BACT